MLIIKRVDRGRLDRELVRGGRKEGRKEEEEEGGREEGRKMKLMWEFHSLAV